MKVGETVELLLGSQYNSQKNELSFRVYSKNASHIDICFYTHPVRGKAVFIAPLTKEQNDMWTTTIPLVELNKVGIVDPYVYYGYRCWGPNWPYHTQWEKGSQIGFSCDVDAMGNRFNPNKLLIDPYARELSHDPEVSKLYIDPNVYVEDYYGGDYNHCRTIDTGEIAPKSIALLSEEQVDYGMKPRRLLKDDIIYEVNLRGLTMANHAIAEKERGTFKGAAQMAGYFTELGITAVEFLPIQEFADEQNDDGDPRGDNYWGYMTLNYFSPNRRYSSDKRPGGPTREFKEMVKSFHGAGIKVFLDMVFNHTGEGLLRRKIKQGNPSSKSEIEKTLQEAAHSRAEDQLQDVHAACIMSLTGLDNSSYYYLRNKNARYKGLGGCGGNLNYDNIVVKNMITHSLKYWADEMGVDGFRFDLAPILSVTKINGIFQPDIHTTFFQELSNVLPARSISFDKGVDLIAEPWGEESNLDWLDKFPPSWSVWNKNFRDVLKIAMNKYGVIPLPISEIAKVVSGSEEEIKKGPWNSINYIVSHDDCNCLKNIFTYNRFFQLQAGNIKDNQISWDQGGSEEAQQKAVRNALTLLLLSAGVPMLAAGDEFFRTIPAYDTGIGKMNMVAVDHVEAYVNFAKYNEMKKLLAVAEEEAANQLIETSAELYVFLFVKNLIQFRNKHECLRPDGYFSGQVALENGLKDIAWYKADGSENSGLDWNESDFLAYRINAQGERVKDIGDHVESIYVAYNRSPRGIDVVFPKECVGKSWFRVLDTDNTNGWMFPQRNFDDGKTLMGKEYYLHERSIVVLLEK